MKQALAAKKDGVHGVFIASLATETNTFAPFPTGLAGFGEYGVVKDALLREGSALGKPMPTSTNVEAMAR